MENAREAVPEDLGALAGLWRQAVREQRGRRGGELLAAGLPTEQPADHLSSALGDPERLVVSGLIDDVPVGVASAYVDHSAGAPLCTLEVLYVEPLARQIGVGEAMLDVVTEWARAKGCAGVDAPALPGSRTAKAFFEEHGFLARLIVMHRPTSDRRGGREGGPS